MLTDWLQTPQGRYVLDWEQRQFDNAVDDVFGYYGVQIGLPGHDFMQQNRIPLRVSAGLEAGCQVRTEPWSLPFASQSIDLVALPHVLEFAARPHAILREAERVLMPEGSIVISGFNPASLWGMKRLFASRRDELPWAGKFIGLLRLRDWLHLLGFELTGGRFGCYAPPFASSRWLERSGFMEKAGDRWWPIAGGVYVVRAVKRVAGMRLVRPSWRGKASQALAPAVAQREAAKIAERVIRSAARRDGR